MRWVNPQTYMQTHHPTVYKAGLIRPPPPPPLGFHCVTTFRKYFTFSSRSDVLYKTMYILWSAALLGACYVIQSGRHLVHHLDRHLGFPLI